MPATPKIRLYVEDPLAANAQVALAEKQAHYLNDVMRLKEGDSVALFNGQDGEWEATLDAVRKKEISLTVKKRIAPQKAGPDLWLLCAPLKGGKTEWVAEKGTELGISRLCPVATQFTVVDRINEARFKSIFIESSEQCERMDVPQIDPLMPLNKVLGSWGKERRLIYGDESGGSASAAQLSGLKAPLAVLIGPEGGFSQEELALLRSLPYVTGVCMGPRILRADTAAISALTLVQAASGGFEEKPAFRSVQGARCPQ